MREQLVKEEEKYKKFSDIDLENIDEENENLDE